MLSVASVLLFPQETLMAATKRAAPKNDKTFFIVV
jgi:hypothetical protein